MILVDDILHSLDTIDIFDQISYQFQHLRCQIKINSYLTDKTDIVMKKNNIFHSLFDSTLQQ